MADMTNDEILKMNEELYPFQGRSNNYDSAKSRRYREGIYYDHLGIIFDKF